MSRRLLDRHLRRHRRARRRRLHHHAAMTRLTEKPCDLCAAESFEWYQTVCHGCGAAFCRRCAGAWPHYCIRCEGPGESGPPASP